MRIRNIGGSILLVVAVAFIPTAAAAATCESLAELALPNATITSVQAVAAGAFVRPGVDESSADDLALERQRSAGMPPFCRITATLHPSSDSDIKIEVWMPSTGWNGKFLGVGGAGWAGRISYAPLRGGLWRGYSVASTDTGHTGGRGDASFALGHPEKLIDFGYRAVHEMTVAAKAMVAAFYDEPSRLSYWWGCSTGGKQGLTEAQRFPEDYDGILAGAPANYLTHLMAGMIWAAHAMMIEPASTLSQPEFQLLNDAAINSCDALDGVEDGVLENPAQCGFDPQIVQCEGADGSGCLTAAQVAAVRKVYAPATNPRTGEIIFPGLARGSERGWQGQPVPVAISYFKHVVFEDPEWDFRTFDFDGDVARADRLDNGTLNAIDPDLRPFTEAGGKLILYHGWNDVLITPYNTIDYYKSVVETLGAAETESSVRLFMAPGMNHCGGGSGPSQVDWLGELERWVEDGAAPDRIVASRMREGEVVRTRPLCPYPQVSRYKGTGSIDDAANFECVAPGAAR